MELSRYQRDSLIGQSQVVGEFALRLELAAKGELRRPAPSRPRYPSAGIDARESSNVSLSVSGRPSALDRFRSANALAFELIFTQRLNRAARASIRTSGVGSELLDIAFNAEM